MSIRIYHYLPEDLDKFEFNKYSRKLKNNKKDLAAMKFFLAQAHSYTLFDTTTHKVVAVLAFFEYAPHRFNGCIIASRLFGKNPKYALKMRYLINCLRHDFTPERVETISEDIPQLNKWHQFLGFKLEMKLPAYLEKRDYILWSM